jgi:hypothetical protein
MIGKFVSALAVMACISCFAAHMNAQQNDCPLQPGVPPQAESKDSNSDQLAYTPPPFDPSIFVDVDPSLSLDANTLALYNQMASTLNGSTLVPQDRLNYYSAYANSNTLMITAWSAYVENVQANCNGYLVTIRVQAGINSTTTGPSTLLDGPNYFEKYQVVNGQFAYQGFLDPDGTSGQRFGEIGL